MAEVPGITGMLRMFAYSIKSVFTKEYGSVAAGGVVGGLVSAFTAEALRAAVGVKGLGAVILRAFIKILLAGLALVIARGTIGLKRLFAIGASVGAGISLGQDLIYAAFGTTPEAEGWKFGMAMKALITGTKGVTTTPPSGVSVGTPQMIEETKAPPTSGVW